MTSTDNTPNAAKLIESLRFTGYTNYTAIADLVDNSLDAFAGLVKIEIGTHEDDHLITIADNGVGMDIETLDQALRLGSNTSKDSKSDLGKYGLGLVTASISFSRTLKVITKKEGHYLVAEHDIDKIKKADKFVKEIRQANDAEKNFFMQKLGGSISGTILILSKIDRLQNSNLSIYRSTLMAHLGETFREYIGAGKKIYVQDKEVRAVDPLMRDADGTDILSEEEHEFVLADGTKETIKVRVSCLPKDLEESKTGKLGINQHNQGFYVMRNRRQIARGETLGVFTKHNRYNRFRAELFISGNIDSELGASFTKDEIKINDSIRGWVEKVVYPQILTIANRSRKEVSKEAVQQIDHKSSEQAIKNKAKLLSSRPTMEMLDGPEEENWRKQHVEEVEFVTLQHGRLAPLFTFESLGRKIVITYNADHPFFITVFDQIGENKELTNAIDFFTYSVATGLSRITTEKTEKLVESFIVTFSDNLRTLLSN